MSKGIKKIKLEKPAVAKKSAAPLQSVKGTRDVLPQEMRFMERIRSLFLSVADAYGFEGIETPILEDTELFIRAVGKSTDVVQKQMYTFRTKGGDSVTLRPENTAGIARAYYENGMFNLPQPLKLWYWGPMFRYERQQAGRYRQFHQFGAEIIGEINAVLDAQLIQLFTAVLKELGITAYTVEINSLGCKTCRPEYRAALVNYFRPDARKLCPDCKRRLKESPLRIFECDKEKCKEIAEKAPQTVDHLCEECHGHFKEVLEYLDEIDVPYRMNARLVRGLDYYTKTVFEVWPEDRPGWALGGGGRYDNLVEILGDKSAPAVGFSAGIERVVEELTKIQASIAKDPFSPTVFLAQLGELGRKKSLKLFEKLRKAGIRVVESFGRNSIKSQLKVANREDAGISLIVGQKEALDETVIIRDMASGIQETVPLTKLIHELQKRFAKTLDDTASSHRA
ncbi:MAG: histidine--tRNA ligase [bacterium]|nr:histidine--tRNA ligase [bacterium]